ncbi:MAG TPA: hypothetical protein VJA27_04245 [Patescibacteria group bacterium]|nr:hypothetical protein [Patescibacteria group bacterium]
MEATVPEFVLAFTFWTAIGVVVMAHLLFLRQLSREAQYVLAISLILLPFVLLMSCGILILYLLPQIITRMFLGV